jgi:hypothetical protein
MMEIQIILPLIVALIGIVTVLVLSILGMFTNFNWKQKQSKPESNVNLDAINPAILEQELNLAA